MTDDRGRKRDTPDGVFGAGAPSKKAPAPRGAGLSGNLPGSSRYASHDPTPGSVPITIQNEPRQIVDREHDAHDPRRAHEREPHEPSRGGPRDAAGTPSRRPGPPEPPMAAPRSPAPHRPQTVRGVDGFAATRPAEPVAARAPSMSSLDPTARAAKPGPGNGPGGASARPNERPAAPRSPENKPSLRLKLEGDTYYEAGEGRVRVPKRRGPMFFGVLVLLVMLAGGAVLWLDAHGGVSNFVAVVRHVVDPDAPDPSVQTSLTSREAAQNQAPTTGPTAQAPTTGPTAQAPSTGPAAQAPTTGPAQPSAAAQPPSAAEAKPSEPQQPGQIATGEVEAPENQPTSAQPANETGVKPAQPVEAKPKPKPAAPIAVKPKPKPPVRRDPVLKVQPLGDVLNAAPPDPSGAATLPPPDPPAPD